MSLPALLAIILGASLTAYAVLAGADFGAGILDLSTDIRPRRAALHNDSSDREAIAASIGPLWEANHVWLIFSITILFSAFPLAFSALGPRLLAPLTVGLLAIVSRSVALGLRGSAGMSAHGYRRLSAVFGLASVVAPFAFGTIAGGLAQRSTTAPAHGSDAPAIPWSSPFALAVGLLAVAQCTQLAALFVTLRCARSGQPGAAERFRRRGLMAGIAVLLLMVGTLTVAALSVPTLGHRVAGGAMPAVVAGFAVQVLALVALTRCRYLIAHAGGVGSAALVLWGWLVAQSPRLVGPRLTLDSAAATHAALVAVAVSVGAVLVIVVPAMFLLFSLFSRPVLEVFE